ncbi:hypothetical protein LU196_13460 [Pantoea sp. Mb-10]|uniref:hypothetical protein n=1 Tax=unclassified Pantoea TaxID=2630326 RepID=UPI001E35025C|nr:MULTISPECIES: hypothetical protein [unclassified Pantoea]MCE0491049.1 hypothetical protein [Pantoea sp. Mb-10]MCE0502538.1 hypothetical protein [Pantoea sp. Pb-8]
MKNDTTAEDIYAVIGTVVARLLKPEQHLTLHEITTALHAMGEDSSDRTVRDACRAAVVMLSKQMH